MNNGGRRYKIVKVENRNSLTAGILNILLSVVFALAAVTSGNYIFNFAIAATTASLGAHYMKEGLGKITNVNADSEKNEDKTKAK